MIASKETPPIRSTGILLLIFLFSLGFLGAPLAATQLIPQDEEINPSQASWQNGVITQSAYVNSSTRRTVIGINSVSYVLTYQAILREKGEDRSGRRYEVSSGVEALQQGRRVSFQAVGANHGFIAQITVDLIPRRR
jgi:hypothetical protein